MSEADGFEQPDEIPADVRLIPAQSEARRARVRMVILVPVLAPGGQLERAKPPNINAGIAFGFVPKMRKAVHQALQVQRVDQSQSAHPEKAHPAKSEKQSTENGKHDDGRFEPSPVLVDSADQFRRPSWLVGRLGLIEPAQVRPPESTLLGTGNVLRGVRDGVMQAMIRDPACRMTRAIEDGPENQKLLDKAVGLECFVGEHAVIANRSAQPAKGDEEKSQAQDFKTWQRKKNQPDHGEDVNEDEIDEDAFLTVHWFPKGPFPGTRLLRGAKFH